MFYLPFDYQYLITIWIRLTEIYKMTIACFKPTISVGSTLTHVRFITWTTQYTCWLVERDCEGNKQCPQSINPITRKKGNHNFVHQVFGAVAGDCSSLDNWRFILLLRLGNLILLLSFCFYSFYFRKNFQKKNFKSKLFYVLQNF